MKPPQRLYQTRASATGNIATKKPIDNFLIETIPNPFKLVSGPFVSHGPAEPFP